MSSLVIYGNEFAGHIDNGLVPQSFKYRFLAEGDSWMDRSAMFSTSLLQQLAPAMDAGGDDVLIINVAMFGDTMRRIGDCAKRDFKMWVNTQFNWKFDGLLLSAGGNDFIDAARDPGPGQGILRDFSPNPIPANGRDCLNPTAVQALTTQYMDPCFAKLYQVVQSSRHANVPIFLNCYDTPTARNAPAIRNGRSWLFDSFVKNNIPPGYWHDLTDEIFKDVRATVEAWAYPRNNLILVPTCGTLTPAVAGETGSSNDWLNEIHPNESGWQKLAKVWQQTIKANLP